MRLNAMRRYTFLILFVIVLVTPFMLRIDWDTRQLPPRAPMNTIIIITPHMEGIRREFGDAFTHWHRKNMASRMWSIIALRRERHRHFL